MTLHRFFVPGPVEKEATGVLDASQSRQVQSVLRLRSGDQIVVFDGSGAEGTATLTDLERRSAAYRIGSVAYPSREPEIDLMVGLALLRGDRFELAVQKLTELGVRRIVPLEAERCVVTFRDARDWDKRANRLRRIIVEAMEQAERVSRLELAAPSSLEAFLAEQATIALRERGNAVPLAAIPMQAQVTLAVGPEGGWSDNERGLIDRLATPASLGGLILRSETAAIVAAATVIQRSITTP